MRKPPQWLICILIINGYSAESSQIPPVDEVLQTEQYIFVVQQNGNLFVESQVPDGKCPKFMTRISSNDKIPNLYQGLHLLKEPSPSFPTRFMTVTVERYFVRVFIYQINGTETFKDPLEWRMHMISKESNLITRYNLCIEERELVNTLYDSTRRLLFLDFSTPGLERIEQFYLSDPYDKDRGVLRLKPHEKNETGSRRFGWIEDPYSDMFYYQEQHSDGVSLFKAPINTFWRIITRKENGKIVKKLSDNELLKGVVGEAIHTVQINTEFSPIRTFLTPINSSTRIVCEVASISQKLPKDLKVLAIRNDDYCHIRDGADFDFDRCAQEQNEYMSLKRYMAGDVEKEVDVLKWLLIACLFMFTLVVLMCVYVYWLRNSFVVEEERSHEYDTEASLFVSKQRSFPSVYHDPGLMDVSVDKWN